MTATALIAFCLLVCCAAFCWLILGTLTGTSPNQASGPMREFAQELDGQHFPARDSHLITFRDHDVSFRFSATHAQRQKQSLKLSAPWPDSEFRIRLFPEVLSDDIKRFIGMRDIKIGAKKFDDTFVIQSNNEKELIKLLTPGAQHLITETGDDINLTISGGTFAIDWKGHLVSRYLVMKAIRQSVAVYHALLTESQYTTGVELTFIEVINATCMVCGETMKDSFVTCKRCKTPHHHDCWEYLGMCSTYGCGSKRKREKSKSPKI